MLLLQVGLARIREGTEEAAAPALGEPGELVGRYREVLPFERNAAFGDRQWLTDEEFNQRLKQTATQLQSDNAEFNIETADTANAGAVGSATSPPPHWLERGETSRRTSLVIDPPDGRIPPMTDEGRRRVAATPAGGGNGPFDGPEQTGMYVRCIARGVPTAIFPAVYNANTRIAQGPGYAAVTYEMIHDTRIIPTDGRAHVRSDILDFEEMMVSELVDWIHITEHDTIEISI